MSRCTSPSAPVTTLSPAWISSPTFGRRTLRLPSRTRTSPSTSSTRPATAPACSGPEYDAGIWAIADWSPPAASTAASTRSTASELPGVGVVLEARVLAEESELHRADGPVSLLADDDLGDALLRRVRIVDLVAVDEEDEVGVLLDRARLAQVRHHRALVRPLLEPAVELRQRDHGNLQLLRERLERARDLRDLGRPVLALARRLHELEVIDHDQAQRAVLPVQAPRARAQLERVQRRGLVDVDRRVVQLADRGGEPVPVLVRQLAGAQLVLVEPPDRAEH